MDSARYFCRLRIFADYHQFYVWGAESSQRHVPEEWTDQDVAHRAKIAPGVVIICPVRNMEVPVSVGIREGEPPLILDQWQHVIEAPLSVNGRIEIDECTGEPQAGFTVPPGEYTVRALYRGLDTLSEDGLEGDDLYEIQIWKAPCAGLRILRCWD
jgi:hypothetical protein